MAHVPGLEVYCPADAPPSPSAANPCGRAGDPRTVGRTGRRRDRHRSRNRPARRAGRTDVCITARSDDELEQTAWEAECAGERVAVVACDLTGNGNAKMVIEEAVRQFGRLDMLVNNAGGAHRMKPLDELDERTFALRTELNYSSVYRTMHAVAPHLMAAAPGAAIRWGGGEPRLYRRRARPGGGCPTTAAPRPEWWP